MSLVHAEASPFVQHYMFAKEHLGCTSFEAGMMAHFNRDLPLTEAQAEYVKAHWRDDEEGGA